MSTHAYTESQLVEQPAIGLFAALGWQMVSARSETLGSGGTLGRETKGEVVLVDRLRAALGKLNPALPSEAIQSAIDELTRDRSATSLEAANREIYRLLKDGILVSVLDPEHGGQKTERLRVIDWEQPEQNDFLLVSDAANRLAPLPGPVQQRRGDDLVAEDLAPAREALVGGQQDRPALVTPDLSTRLAPLLRHRHLRRIGLETERLEYVLSPMVG
jgi:hypothetical protein